MYFLIGTYPAFLNFMNNSGDYNTYVIVIEIYITTFSEIFRNFFYLLFLKAV